MPDVPVLVQSGELDTNTPIEAGRQAAAQFAHPIFAIVGARATRPTGSPAGWRWRSTSSSTYDRPEPLPWRGAAAGHRLAGTGREKRYPWPSSQPSARNAAACSGRSIPSATTT